MADLLTVPALLRRNAQTYASNTAFRVRQRDKWLSLNWADVYERVEALAAGMLEAGVSRGDVVAIVSANRPETYISQWAAQTAGAVPVCLYADMQGPELTDALAVCEPRLVVSGIDGELIRLDEAALPVSALPLSWDDSPGRENRRHSWVDVREVMARGRRRINGSPGLIDAMVDDLGPDDDAIIIYTSGTTGTSKGVVGSHRYMLEAAARYESVIHPTQFCDFVSFIAPAWATEQYLGLTLAAQLPMTVHFPEGSESAQAVVREVNPEVVFLTPRQWEDLAREYQELEGPPDVRLRALGLASARTALNGGGLIGPDTFAFFSDLGISIRNVYGFSEVGIVAATHGEERFDSVGTVLTSAYGEKPLRVRIQDGEIQTSGGVQFSRYWRRPDLTAERFTPDGWARSGDAGRFDGDHLIYVDRLGDVQQRETGMAFSPQLAENALRACDLVADAVVVGSPEHGFLVALLVLVDGAGGEQLGRLVDQVRACNKDLGTYGRVGRFAVLEGALTVESGDLTRSGKLRRHVFEANRKDLIADLFAAGEDAALSDTPVAAS